MMQALLGVINNDPLVSAQHFSTKINQWRHHLTVFWKLA